MEPPRDSLDGRMKDPVEDDLGPSVHEDRAVPGGPYFGRLLIVLLLAVAFCGFMTWFLSTTLTD